MTTIENRNFCTPWICRCAVGLFPLLVFGFGCSSGGESSISGLVDTATELDAIEVDTTDRRHIPATCTKDEECDDGDACTVARCALGECVYVHQFEPLETQRLTLSGSVTDAAIIGNRLYAAVSGASPEIQIFGLPEEGPPELRDTVILSGPAIGLDATWQGFVTVEGELGLEAFSSDNPESPVFAALADEDVLEQIDAAVNVTISSSYAYVAGYEKGITMLSGELNAPQRAGTLDTPGRAVAVAARGGSALVADSLGGAVSIWLENEIPVLGKAVSTLGRVLDADIQRNTAIIAEYGAGFSIVDFSRVQEPRRLARVETDFPVVAVRMSGAQTALVFLESGELIRIGLIDYQTPLKLESIQLDAPPVPHGVDFYNNIGVVTLTTGKVQIVYNGCTY